MKDTYWLAIGIFALMALVAFGSVWEGRRRAARLAREGSPNVPRQKSIWRRDLSETRVGRFLLEFLFPPVCLVFGVLDIAHQRARWHGFDYRGFDATCIGLGLIGMGIAGIGAFTFSRVAEMPGQVRTVFWWGGMLCFAVFFSIALFRNI